MTFISKILFQEKPLNLTCLILCVEELFHLTAPKNCNFNITFNYDLNYRKHNFNIKHLNNKAAANVIPELKRVIGLLGDQTSDNYWEPIDGNAKRALITLLTMAQMRPDAIIKVEY